MATVAVEQVGALIDERLAPVLAAITDVKATATAHQEALAALGSRQRKILEQHNVLNDLQQKQQATVAATEAKIAEIVANIAAMDEVQRTLMASLPGEGKSGGRLVGSKRTHARATGR